MTHSIDPYPTPSRFNYFNLGDLSQEIIKNPNQPIVLPHNFTELIQRQEGPFSTLFCALKKIIGFFWHKIKLLFSKSYRLKFQQSIEKIYNVYKEEEQKKLSLESQFNKSQETYTKVKKQICILKTTLAKQSKKVNLLTLKLSSLFEKQKKVNNLLESLHQIENSHIVLPYYYAKTTSELHQKILSLDPKYNKTTQTSHLHDNITRIQLQIFKIEETKKDLLSQLTSLKTEKKTLESSFINLEKKMAPIKQSMTEVDIAPQGTTSAIDEPNLTSNYERMIADLNTHTDQKHLSELWTLLLNSYPEVHTLIKRWRCTPNGQFFLRFKATLKIWINTKNPKGGCIFLLGNNPLATIEGVLTKNCIKFNQGFDSHCMFRFLIYKRITPHMTEIKYSGKDQIQIGGKLLGRTQHRTYKTASLSNEWKSVEIVPDDYPGGYGKFLEKKFKQAK